MTANSGPPALDGLDEDDAKKIMRVLYRHVPTSVTIGTVVSMTPHVIAADDPRVLVSTRTGHFYAGRDDVIHVRRLDSALAESWDISAGRIERIRYRAGCVIGRTSADLTSVLDQALQPLRDQGVE